MAEFVSKYGSMRRVELEGHAPELKEVDTLTACPLFNVHRPRMEQRAPEESDRDRITRKKRQRYEQARRDRVNASFSRIRVLLERDLGLPELESNTHALDEAERCLEILIATVVRLFEPLVSLLVPSFPSPPPLLVLPRISSSFCPVSLRFLVRGFC